MNPLNGRSEITLGERLLRWSVRHLLSIFLAAGLCAAESATKLTLSGDRWLINDRLTYPGTRSEGLLLNVRMVNASFEDRNRPEFDADANTAEFVAKIPDYVSHGVRAFTLSLQGGMPGYEGANNSAFNADGSLRDSYMARIRRVIQACDQHGAIVILGCYYQRQDQILANEDAVKAGVVNAAKWIQATGHRNVTLEIANEFGHDGFNHHLLRRPEGIAELIRLAKTTVPGLLVSSSGVGDGGIDDAVAQASDFLLIHFNGTRLEAIPSRIAALKKYRKPIVCNEDQKWGEAGAQAAELSVANGASWGLMLEKLNQHFPFAFNGAADDPAVYAAFQRLSSNENFSQSRDLDSAFRLVRDSVNRGEIPGAIALVAQGGKILQHEAWGLADIEKQVPFKTNTLCWIASITKPATVAAAMTLVDAGKLRLDDLVETFLPEFRSQTDSNGVHYPFTIRHLMSHTSGLVPNPPTRRSAWPIGGPLDDFWLEQKLPDIVQTIARSQLRFKPGSRFEYSNSSLFVLGRIIEIISGQPYARYVRETILEPLGMNDTTYAPIASEPGRVAVIYGRRNDQRETVFRFNPAINISNAAPDGGLFSYPSQLVPFIQLFLENSGKILSKATVNEMLTPQPHGWGLGWSLSGGLFLHEGSSGTLAWADPATGVIGIIFLQYRDQNKTDERVRTAFRKLVSEAFPNSNRNSRTNRAAYFPPPESSGGWRQLSSAEDIKHLGGMDPAKLDALKQWLLTSDNRDFAASIIRHGYLVLEVERKNSARTNSRRVASVSKAICATVLAIASDQSQRGATPKKMKFDDLAFQFIPWAQPLSDLRKAQITVKQLLNHTSGICPEATGAPNDGSWQYILGHTGDARTAQLAFDPGAGCGYSTHALVHAALVCETVTGQPYDKFAIQALFKPLGIEHWWFQSYDGSEKYGRHPSHGMGMPARDLARIGYCMLRGGRWNDRQVIPRWFIDETAAPTHDVRTPELRWKLNPQIFSHGWELPARLTGENGRTGAGIPSDARAKPGSGGQYLAFIPSLDLVLTRQTGSSGDWQFEEFLRRACAAVAE